MNWKKWGAIVSLLLVFWVWQEWPDGRLQVVFCDVGQGDSAVVVLRSFQALIDTGANKVKLTECLSRQMPFWDRKIEVVFISHSDKDHIGALEEVRVRYKVEKIIDQPRRNDVVRFGSLSFDIIKGNEPEEGVKINGENESNARSVVMRVAYGSFSALFTGDIDTDSELALVERGVLNKTEVLKVSHHGSKYGSAKEFLEVLRPKLAIISVGGKNNYGHPNGDTLMRLEEVGTKILRTDTMGTVSLMTDGKTLEVFREK